MKLVKSTPQNRRRYIEFIIFYRKLACNAPCMNYCEVSIKIFLSQRKWQRHSALQILTFWFGIESQGAYPGVGQISWQIIYQPIHKYSRSVKARFKVYNYSHSQKFNPVRFAKACLLSRSHSFVRLSTRLAEQYLHVCTTNLLLKLTFLNFGPVAKTRHHCWK